MGRSSTPIFRTLDTGGRFHRDSAIGRVLHPGTVSYREIAATDSVHVAVTPDNRVSVHIDRVSPLLVRAGRRCRYSITRAVLHNLTAIMEGLGRVLRRERGVHACHLDCEIVWVADEVAGEEAGPDPDEVHIA